MDSIVVDRIVCIKQIIDKRRALGLDTPWFKAYDSNPLSKLWQVLEEPQIHIQWNDANDNDSKHFEITKGLNKI